MTRSSAVVVVACTFLPATWIACGSFGGHDESAAVDAGADVYAVDGGLLLADGAASKEAGSPADGGTGAGGLSTIASGVVPLALAASPQAVAWLQDGTFYALRVMGAAAPVATPDVSVAAKNLVVVGTGLFWSQNGSVAYCALNGAPCNMPAIAATKTGTPAAALAVQDGAIVIGSQEANFIAVCTGMSCGDVSNSVTGLPGKPTNLAASTGGIVAGVSNNSATHDLIAVSGKVTNQLIGSVQSLGGLAASSTRVYWTEPTSNKIRAVDFTGGNADDILTGRVGPRELVIDGSIMYWVEPDVPAVYACKLPDCAKVVPLASTIKKPKLLAVGDRVYFASEQDAAIYAVPLPAL